MTNSRTKGASFVIHGKPFAKQRPRMTRRGITYTPSETVSFENTVRAVAAEKFLEPLEGPVRVIIEAHFETPKSWPKAKTAALQGKPHIQRPDIDNIEKAILDGLNRIAFADDSQVCDMRTRKHWGIAGRTIVTVEAVDA